MCDARRRPEPHHASSSAAVSFALAVDPVSLVSEPVAAAAFAREVAARASAVPFVLAGPVTLTVRCVALPSRHPRTVVYPNLDRWIAALLESLAGAERVLLGSSQVTRIMVSTKAPFADPRTLSISLAYRTEQCLPKAQLLVNAFPNGWCAPLATPMGSPRVREIARAPAVYR
jgi:hypothetical protein